MSHFQHIRTLLLFVALPYAVTSLAAQEGGAGAFILVSVEGAVQVKDAAGETLPAGEIVAGKSLFEGQTVITGENSIVVLLLSNGSVTTLNAKSELLLDKFQQAKFELDPASMVSDLKTEPSTSETKLKLGYGDLTFNVKKLNAGSSFDIESPVGSAGIRGTDGQMVVTVDPQTGNFSGGLNMLSGAVAFTSPAGNLVNVPAGQAVQAQATPTGQQVGQVQEAPVPPQVTQKMTQTTTEAKATTAEIRMGQVTAAVAEVEQKIQRAPPRKNSDGKKPEKKPGDKPKEKPSSKGEGKERKLIQRRVAPKRESAEELLETDDKASLAQQGIIVKDPKEAKKLKSLGLKSDELAQLRKVSDKDRKELLAGGNLSDVKKNVRERVEKEDFIDKLKAKDPSVGRTLNLDSLSRDEVEHLSNLGNSDRKKLLKSGNKDQILEGIQKEVEKEKIKQMDLAPDDLVVISSYSPPLQKRLREDIEPDLVQSLLKLRMKEEEMALAIADLHDARIEDVLPVTISPTHLPIEDISAQLRELMALTQENGNPEIVDILLNIGGGKLDEMLLELGRQANAILSPVQVSGTLDHSRVFSIDQLQENIFYTEPVALADIFFHDDMDSPLFSHVSKSSQVSGILDLSDFYEIGQYLSISATQHIELSGNIEIDPVHADQETYLSFLSSETLGISPRTSVVFFGDNLHIGAWESMEVVNVSMESGRDLTIQTMEDLFIQDSTLRVREGDSIHISAQRDLMLNEVAFSNNLREIYMQATTIDLMNINFPGGSQVNMATMYGGVDGKYPTFGASQRAVGRVNFINNVSYDKNLMKNPIQFDKFGQNIQIQVRKP